MKRNSIPAGLAACARAVTNARHLTFRRAWLWIGFLTLVTMPFGPRPAQAAVIEAWVHRHSNVASNAADQAVKVVRDAAGDIIVTGTTSGFTGGDMVTIKYSGSDGSVLWQQRYDGPANGDDRPCALAVDGSGNVLVTGYSEHELPSGIYTAKYAAADGALIWERHGPAIGNEWQNPANVAVEGNGNVVVTGSTWNGSDYEIYAAKYSAANGELLWERRGPVQGYGYSTAVAVDGSGNVLVAGSSYGDYYTAKYAAADGALLWERRYNGPANHDDSANAVAADGSGNVVVTGYSQRTSKSNDYEYYTAKYAAADGALLWERRGPAIPYIWQNPADLAVDGGGNVVVTGPSLNDGLDYDYYTAKYAATDGALLWEQRYNGSGNSYDQASALAVDGSDNVVVTGRSRNNGTDFDYYTAKYAAVDGALLWEQRYNGPANGSDLANAVAVDTSGNVVVTGRADSFPIPLLGLLRGGEYYTGGDYYTAKYAAADGALLWEQTYDGSASRAASARAVAVDGNGNVVVTGFSASHFDFRGDCYTAKYAAADGALLWERRGPTINNDPQNPASLAVDGNGNIVVTGYSWSDGTGFDSYTAKYAATDGALLWEKFFNGPASGNDFASAVAVDGSGNVVVTGRSGKKWTDYDYFTAKYAAADGALLWEQRYNGPADSDDAAYDVAADGSGNVVVTGYSWNRTNGNYYTAKYAAADGTLLWERRGPAIPDMRQNPANLALAVDGSGNVVVTGSSYKGTNRDYYTAKYAAADGALLWERRYNGPANRGDSANAVAVDGSGNVLVTGYSESSIPYMHDYYTAKYAAADGALLWEKRYNGPANDYDAANAVEVDASGNVVVTGYSYGTSSKPDSYTAKYAAAYGALLWEKRLAGAASVFDSSRCLALGPDGRVFITKGAFTTVAYRDLPAVFIDPISAGVRLRVTGVPNRSYNIERAPAVTGPWSTINTQTAPASGPFEYHDTNPPSSAAFYRMREP